MWKQYEILKNNKTNEEFDTLNDIMGQTSPKPLWFWKNVDATYKIETELTPNGEWLEENGELRKKNVSIVYNILYSAKSPKKLNQNTRLLFALCEKSKRI